MSKEIDLCEETRNEVKTLEAEILYAMDQFNKSLKLEDRLKVMNFISNRLEKYGGLRILPEGLCNISRIHNSEKKARL